jgi:hypothetical protein
MIFDGSTPLTMTGQCLCNYCINVSSLYHEMNFTYSATVRHPDRLCENAKTMSFRLKGEISSAIH